jgi:hypothetical protein
MVGRTKGRSTARQGAPYDREVQPRPTRENWSAELDRLLTTNASKSARERLTLILPKDKLTAADIARPRLPDQTERKRPSESLKSAARHVARTGEAHFAEMQIK